MKYSDRLVDLTDMLDCEDVDDRVAAIEALGDIGDEQVLKILRERLRIANREMNALVIAVGKVKKRLKVT